MTPKKLLVAPQDCSFPLFYSLALVSWLNRRGANFEELFAETGLTIEQFCDPQSRVSFKTISKLIANAERYYGKPGLGLEFGKKLTLSSLGNLGQVCMTSESNRVSCRMFEKYYNTLTLVMDMELRGTKDSLTFVFDWKFKEAAQNRYYVDVCLAATARFLRMLLNRDVETSVTLTEDDGGYPDAYKALFTGDVQFNQPSNSLTFFSDNLDEVLPSANPLNFAQARKRAEAELAKIGSPQTILEIVEAMINNDVTNPPSLVDISNELGISERSVQRHLKDHNTSYRQCVDNVLSKKTKVLLTNPDMTIRQVSELMNFDTPASLTRSFKRWYGITPSEFRETQF